VGPDRPPLHRGRGRSPRRRTLQRSASDPALHARAGISARRRLSAWRWSGEVRARGVRSNPRGGAAFDDPDVARAYMHRPPYHPPLYDFLVELVPCHRRVLDLGCGTGKLAHGLAAHFEHVDAVDPSLPMLRLADDGRHDNITWIHGFAETALLDGPY